jgi:hypothetical protein
MLAGLAQQLGGSCPTRGSQPSGRSPCDDIDNGQQRVQAELAGGIGCHGSIDRGPETTREGVNPDAAEKISLAYSIQILCLARRWVDNARILQKCYIPA